MNKKAAEEKTAKRSVLAIIVCTLTLAPAADHISGWSEFDIGIPTFGYYVFTSVGWIAAFSFVWPRGWTCALIAAPIAACGALFALSTYMSTVDEMAKYTFSTLACLGALPGLILYAVLAFRLSERIEHENHSQEEQT